MRAIFPPAKCPPGRVETVIFYATTVYVLAINMTMGGGAGGNVSAQLKKIVVGKVDVKTTVYIMRA